MAIRKWQATIRRRDAQRLNLGTDNDRLDTLIEKLPDEVDYRRRNIPNITKDALRKIRGTGVDITVSDSINCSTTLTKCFSAGRNV